MSVNSSTNFVASFDSLVKQQYQSGMKLGGKIRTKTDVVGSTHRFPKINKGLATPRLPQTDVIPMDIVHGYATATLADWNAPEYTDILDLSKLNFDEKRELVETSKMAIGRRMDQIIIDAMAASAYSTQVGDDIGGTNTGMNLEKILRAKRLLDDNGVPSDGRYMLTNATAIEKALLEAEVTSGDYNALMPLMNGQVTRFAGFEFIMMESRDEGGLPLSSGIRNSFAFHKDAVGLAIGKNMATKVDWVPEKTSWLINTMFSAGAVTIDTAGVIDVLTNETA